MRGRHAVGIVVLFALVTACDRQPDTEETVRRALEQANMHAVDVAVDEEAKIVHLQGTVGTLADRTRAEEIASAAVGTAGQVLNELTVEALNKRTADDFDGQIADRLDEMVDADDVLKERDINFSVSNGMVAITGEVRTSAEKQRVEELSRAAPGVKDVANGLAIRSDR
jgi:hyperosmotically inducible protein